MQVKGQVKDNKDVFMALAKTCTKDGQHEITVTLTLDESTLIMLARKALHQNTTIDDCITEFLCNDGSGNHIMETLRDYEHEIKEVELTGIPSRN